MIRTKFERKKVGRGRPAKKEKDRKTKVIQVGMTEDDVELLDFHCERRGQNRSHFLRTLFLRYCRKMEKQ